MKTYQKLRKENKSACKAIALTLKDRKCMSRADMISLMQSEKGFPTYYVHPKNFETMFQYLSDHGIMTKEKVNGLVIWVATQKCIRTHIDNMFIEVQEISKTNLSFAQQWVNSNRHLFSFDFQSEYIGKRFFKLDGDILTKFQKEFKDYNNQLNIETNGMHYTPADKKYYNLHCVYYSIENIKELKVI